MRDAAMQDRRLNERAKLRILREIAKWRWWRHAPWLTVTAVITDSHHRFSKRRHVADVKNIAGDDQTTLMVHWNTVNIACTFRIYVCLRLCDRDCCSAADGSGSCHAPAPSISKRWHVADVKNFTGDDQPGNPNGRSKFHNLGLFTFTRLQLTLWWRLRGWRHCVYFPAINRNRFCFHIQKIISRRPWPHRKTEIYILKFFCRFYL